MKKHLSIAALAIAALPCMAQSNYNSYSNPYGSGGSSNPYGNGYGSQSSHGGGSSGEHSVNGYTRRDGTYVQPHHATNPNDSRSDNWSSQGNVNPYTGRQGTVNPYQR